jgi:hypothetical protein
MNLFDFAATNARQQALEAQGGLSPIRSETLLECFFCGNKGELPDPPPPGVVAFVKCRNCGMALIVSGDKLHSNAALTGADEGGVS